MPTPYDTPQDVKDAIGDPLLNRLGARDVRLRTGGDTHISVVDFRLGDSDQYAVVCRHNWWKSESFATGARYNKRGVLMPVPGAAVYFTDLNDIPAAVQQVAARKDRW